jgi:FtsH-binding integral membrane protein
MSERRLVSLAKLSAGSGIIAISLYLGYRAGYFNERRQRQEQQSNDELINHQLEQQVRFYNLENLPVYDPNQQFIEQRRLYISPPARSALLKSLKYLLGGLGITATTAYLLATNRIITPRNYSSAGMAAMIASLVFGIGARLIPLQNYSTKQLFWLIFHLANGVSLAPLASIPSPILIKTGITSVALTIGLSILSVAIRKRSLLMIYFPITLLSSLLMATSLFDLLASFSSTMRSSRLAGVSRSMGLYGGLFLFSLYIMHDINKIIAEAEEKQNIQNARNLIRQSVAAINLYREQAQQHRNLTGNTENRNNPRNSDPGNHSSHNSNNSSESNDRNKQFPGHGYRLGSPIPAAEQRNQQSQAASSGPRSHSNNINGLRAAAYSSNVDRPPPYNPAAVYSVDQQYELDPQPVDYDYPVKPNQREEQEEKKSVELEDSDLQVDPIAASIDFYLDFLNVALRVLEIYLRFKKRKEEASEQEEKKSD